MNEKRERATESLWMRLVEAIRGGEQTEVEAERLAAEMRLDNSGKKERIEMGTRSDFYVGRGEDAEWLGNIAFDGSPDNMPGGILEATEERDYRERVGAFLTSRKDASLVHHGWPWPWNDSSMSSYAYAFDDDAVWYSVGYPITRWWRALDGPEPDDDDADAMARLEIARFPDMTHLKNVTLGYRSGLIVAVMPPPSPRCWGRAAELRVDRSGETRD